MGYVEKNKNVDIILLKTIFVPVCCAVLMHSCYVEALSTVRVTNMQIVIMINRKPNSPRFLWPTRLYVK